MGQAVWDQLDKLRGQLDVAFDEVMSRIAVLEVHVRTVGEQNEELQDAGAAAQAQRTQTLELVQWLMATLEAAVAVGGLPIERGPATVDLGPVAVQLDELDERLDTKLTESRTVIEAGLEQLQQQLAELRSAPVELDTTKLERAATSGAFANGADIAELRKDVGALEDAVRSQGEGIEELRSSLAWIKERLVPR